MRRTASRCAHSIWLIARRADEIVARKVIEIGASVHDPAEIAKTALKLRIS